MSWRGVVGLEVEMQLEGADVDGLFREVELHYEWM